jgi:hypothetical protein
VVLSGVEMRRLRLRSHDVWVWDDGCPETWFPPPPGTPGSLAADELAGLRLFIGKGQLASLPQVVDHYNRARKAAAGVSELRPLHLSVSERRQIVAFLRTLDEPSTAKP